MEEILFDSYRGFLIEKNKERSKAFFNMPLAAIFLIAGMFVTCIGYIVLLCLPISKLYAFLCLGVEFVIYAISYFYTENYRIRIAELKINTYCAHCQSLMEWFEAAGVVIDAKNIAELKNRLEKSIRKKEEACTTADARKQRLMELLLIPVLVVIYTQWMKNESDLSILMGSAMSMLLAFGTVTFIGIGISRVYSFFRRRKLEQLKCFAADLQGILDTQFEGTKLITTEAAGKEVST